MADPLPLPPSLPRHPPRPCRVPTHVPTCTCAFPNDCPRLCLGPSFVCGSSDDSDAYAVDAAYLQQEGYDVKEFFHGEPADSPQPLTPAPLLVAQAVPQEGHDITECGGTE